MTAWFLISLSALMAASMLGDWLKLRARRRQWRKTFDQYYLDGDQRSVDFYFETEDRRR